MLFGRHRKLRPETSTLLNSGRVLTHPIHVGRLYKCFARYTRMHTYIHKIHARATERRMGISAVRRVLPAPPLWVGTGFKGGRYYIWLPGTAHLVYAPCLTQQGRKGPSYSQKRFLAEDLVCCQYRSYEIFSASLLYLPDFRFLLKRAARNRYNSQTATGTRTLRVNENLADTSVLLKPDFFFFTNLLL